MMFPYWVGGLLLVRKLGLPFAQLSPRKLKNRCHRPLADLCNHLLAWGC